MGNKKVHTSTKVSRSNCLRREGNFSKKVVATTARKDATTRIACCLRNCGMQLWRYANSSRVVQAFLRIVLARLQAQGHTESQQDRCDTDPDREAAESVRRLCPPSSHASRHSPPVTNKPSSSSSLTSIIHVDARYVDLSFLS